MATRHSEQRKLVDELQPLTDYGWTIVERGTRCIVTNPEHQQCIINVGSNGGRSTNHLTVLTKLNRMGLQEALQQVATDKEIERHERIRADRARVKPVVSQIPFAEPAAPEPAGTVVTSPDPAPPVAAATSRRTAETPPAPTNSTPAATQPGGPQWNLDELPNIVTRTEIITPERAQQLLDQGFTTRLRNGKVLVPRPVKKRNKDKYVRIIEDNAWILMPGGISLAEDTGDPLNGRHRLTAVVETGWAMPFRVHYNVPAETFAAEDTNMIRSSSDVLHMKGRTSTHGLASSLTLLMAYDTWRADPEEVPSWPSWTRLLFTNDERSEADDRYPELPDHLKVANAAATSAHLTASSIAVFRYVAARAWPEALSTYDEKGARIDTGELDRFCDRLASGEGQRTEPAFTLRQWAIRRIKDPVRPAREIHFLLLVKAWNLHMAGKPLGNIMYRTGEPIPALWTPPAATRRAKRG
jgi:hypothetical protein